MYSVKYWIWKLCSCDWNLTRSPIEMMPTTPSFSTTGRCRIRRSVMIAIDSSMVVSGGRFSAMESSTLGPSEELYPVQFEVEYPDRDLDRLRTAFRLIIAIPILIVLGTVTGWEATSGAGRHASTIAVGTGGALFLAPL